MVGGVEGGVGAACSLALILALAVVLGLWWLAASIERDRRQQREARVERHIDKLYKEILTKSASAAAADYAGLPQPLFDLLSTLRKELGPVLDLGGPMGAMVDRISKALTRETTFTSPAHPIPAEGGTSVLVQPTPPRFLTETKHHPSASGELQQAARDFSAFWANEARIKELIWDTLKKLGGPDLF